MRRLFREAFGIELGSDMNIASLFAHFGAYEIERHNMPLVRFTVEDSSRAESNLFDKIVASSLLSASAKVRLISPSFPDRQESRKLIELKWL